MAKERTAPWPATSFVQGDAGALPFADATFDAVFLATMLGEVQDRDDCRREVGRVLKRVGFAAVSETRRDSDFIRLGELRGLFERHGFAFVGRSGTSWQYVARFAPA